MFYKKKIVLDIETTGLDFNNDKIIEICCLEIRNRVITNNFYHTYVNPKKLISKEAYNIHGISNKFLIKKPIFNDIIKDFLNFISNSKIIIHNAIFDLNFLNKELNLAGFKNINFYCLKIIDTLKISKKLFPNKRNSLDFLCRRFNIEKKKLHSALLDCKALAKIYLIITRKQNNLIFKKKKYNFKYNNIMDNKLILKANSKESLKHNKFFKKFNF